MAVSTRLRLRLRRARPAGKQLRNQTYSGSPPPWPGLPPSLKLRRPGVARGPGGDGFRPSTSLVRRHCQETPGTRREPGPVLLCMGLFSRFFASRPCGASPDQLTPLRNAQFSTLILASRITGPHLSISDFRKLASSAGVEPFGVAPSSSNRDLTGGWASAALVSALIFAMTLGGVLAGTKKPNHDDTSKPGTPASAIVGRSGTTEMRSLVVTASARTLPAFTCGRIDGMLSKVTSTR